MKFTHKGWFYFVPVLCAFEDEGFSAEMRWTGWQWPISIALWIHGLICILHGEGFDYPVYVTGEIDGG